MQSRTTSGRAALWVTGCLAMVLGASGCNDTDKSQAALRVTVTIGADVKASCVRVYAKPDGGDETKGNVIALDGRKSLTIAIFRSAELAGTVEVGARGYVGAKDCSGDLALNEESDAVSATFVDGEVTPVDVTLAKVPDAFDADHDGWRALDANGIGLDCNDASAAVFPGNPEVCGDGLDNDCNGKPDCEDAACDGKACDDGRPCTVGETCAQGLCTGGANVSCDTAPNECSIAPGTCDDAKGGCVYDVRTGQPCTGGTCRMDGACVDQTIEAICDDNQDNDNNGLVDCADSDCDGQKCSDGDNCTDDTVCTAGACAHTAKSCMQTANICQKQSGTCQPADGSCVFAPDPAMAGKPCPNGECHADGTCGASETGAQCGNGLDDDGDGLTDCDDPSCDAQSCDGLDLCFTGKVCDVASKSCTGGTMISCAQPTACQTFNGCIPTSGCNYTAKPTGSACSNGFCDAQGICKAPFPYTPSNFDPLQYPPSQRGGAYTINCGTVTFDTSPNATNGAWCGTAAPTVQTVTEPNGIDVAVLPITDLTVNSGNTLQFVGSRPVVLAVYGNVTVQGTIRAVADHQTPAAGGNSAACSASEKGGGGGTAGGQGAGGGGGGFGSVGAGGGSSTGGNPTAGSGGAVNAAAALLNPLRGGCQAGAGGNGGGAAGAGGGAIQVSVAGTLDVSGVIAAPGGGGRGASGGARGGGGGGSGGAILLEGDQVTLASSTYVSVPGGAGAEGSGTTTPGFDGANGPQNSTNVAGGGGDNSTNGGNGGNGATLGAGAQGGFTGATGGGGGGGGVGYIRINAHTGCTNASLAKLLGQTSSNGAPNCP